LTRLVYRIGCNTGVIVLVLRLSAIYDIKETYQKSTTLCDTGDNLKKQVWR